MRKQGLAAIAIALLVGGGVLWWWLHGSHEKASGLGQEASGSGSASQDRGPKSEDRPTGEVAVIVRFTYDSSGTASTAELQGLFDKGFDVVSSNVTANNLAARKAVNGARGITPP